MYFFSQILKHYATTCILFSFLYQYTDAAICLQIHSLTARSVPRQFREDLRKGLPDLPDRNIRLQPPPPPTITNVISSTKSQSGHSTDIKSQSGHSEAPNSSSSSASDECHVIYDSENRNKVPYPNAEVIRTPSPEHVGIPAGPVKMPPIRSWKSAATSGNTVGYTSDESNTSAEAAAAVAVKPTRRKLLTKQSSNPSVRSLVERYNV